MTQLLETDLDPDPFVQSADQDFRLGLNAAQTTLGAIAQLTGATLRK